MPDLATNVLVEVDGRGRVYLGRLASHHRYLANQKADGTLTFTPVVVMTPEKASRIVAAANAAKADPEPGAEPGESGDQSNGVGPEPDPGRRVPWDTACDQVLAAVRAAGPDGIRSRALLPKVGAARSRVFLILRELVGSGELARNGEAYILGRENRQAA